MLSLMKKKLEMTLLTVLQMYASEYFHEISELLRRLPRVILLMMKTNDCLRAVNNTLTQGSLLETSLKTSCIIGKVSSEAVIDAKRSQSKSVLTWFNIKWDKILLEIQLWKMQMFLWLLQVRKALPWSNRAS